MFPTNTDLLALIFINLDARSFSAFACCSHACYGLMTHKVLWEKCFVLTHGYPLPITPLTADVFYRTLRKIYCQGRVLSHSFQPLYLTGKVVIDVDHHAYVFDGYSLVSLSFSVRTMIRDLYRMNIYINNFDQLVCYNKYGCEIVLAENVDYASCLTSTNEGYIFLLFGKDNDLRYINIHDFKEFLPGNWSVSSIKCDNVFLAPIEDVAVTITNSRIFLYVRTSDDTTYQGALSQADDVNFAAIGQSSMIGNFQHRTVALVNGATQATIHVLTEDGFSSTSRSIDVLCRRSYCGVVEIISKEGIFSTSIMNSQDIYTFRENHLALC